MIYNMIKELFIPSYNCLRNSLRREQKKVEGGVVRLFELQ